MLVLDVLAVGEMSRFQEMPLSYYSLFRGGESFSRCQFPFSVPDVPHEQSQ
jgi:hypothetical protein